MFELSWPHHPKRPFTQKSSMFSHPQSPHLVRSALRGPSTAASSTASVRDRKSFGLQKAPLWMFPASLAGTTWKRTMTNPPACFAVKHLRQVQTTCPRHYVGESVSVEDLPKLTHLGWVPGPGQGNPLTKVAAKTGVQKLGAA